MPVSCQVSVDNDDVDAIKIKADAHSSFVSLHIKVLDTFIYKYTLFFILTKNHDTNQSLTCFVGTLLHAYTHSPNIQMTLFSSFYKSRKIRSTCTKSTKFHLNIQFLLLVKTLNEKGSS